jgi:excisionase family DNA binding protein
LRDILEAAARLAELVEEGRSAFDASWRLQGLVQHVLEVAGEAAAGLPLSFRTAHSDVDWSEPIRTRNRLIHGYHDIDPGRLWDTAAVHMPIFVEQVRELLGRLEGGPEWVEEPREEWGATRPAETTFLTPAEVARQLAVSTRTVYLWIDEGRLPAVRISARVTRVPVAAVHSFVAAATGPRLLRDDPATGALASALDFEVR